jgi:hypothetical protein
MPNVSKEVLELIKAVAIQGERLDGVRNEIKGIMEQLSSIKLSTEKKWDRFWTVLAAVVGAVITSMVTVLFDTFSSCPKILKRRPERNWKRGCKAV